METFSSIGLVIIPAAGRDARAVGGPRTENPIERGSAASMAWFAGWDEADALVLETEEFVGNIDLDHEVIVIRGWP
jgi:hypothetical protein